MMKIITLLNEKGGVGKTTTSIMLAAELARRGNRVCIIDGDSQGHATLALNQDRIDGLYDFVIGDVAINDVLKAVDPYLYNSDDYNLFIIPGGARTRNISPMISDKESNISVLTLKHRIEKIAGSFNYIIIDTSPSISNLHIAYYIASDYIIAPTECTYLPMEGLFASLDHLNQMREQLANQNVPCAELLGIVPTKFYGREIVQHENLGYLKGKYEGYVLPAIRRLSDWEKASQIGELLYTFSPSSRALQDNRAFVNAVLERIEEFADV